MKAKQGDSLRSLAENARSGKQGTWWLWDEEPTIDYGPLLAFAHVATPEAVLHLLDRLDRVERLLGGVRLDELAPAVAETVERAWVESRYEWPEDDPLRVAMLAEYEAPHDGAFTTTTAQRSSPAPDSDVGSAGQ